MFIVNNTIYARDNQIIKVRAPINQMTLYLGNADSNLKYNSFSASPFLLTLENGDYTRESLISQINRQFDRNATEDGSNGVFNSPSQKWTWCLRCYMNSEDKLVFYQSPEGTSGTSAPWTLWSIYVGYPEGFLGYPQGEHGHDADQYNIEDPFDDYEFSRGRITADNPAGFASYVPPSDQFVDWKATAMQIHTGDCPDFHQGLRFVLNNQTNAADRDGGNKSAQIINNAGGQLRLMTGTYNISN